VISEVLGNWVFWALLAAVMQSVRTAIQRHLTTEISPLAATFVRYLFGLPLVAVYLYWLLEDRQVSLPPISMAFVAYCVVAGFLQIIATILLIRLFALRSFVVGSCYVRTEILITAIIGLLVFGEFVSWLGWLAMLTCVAGLILITIAKTGLLRDLWNLSAAYGLAAGFFFSLTSLFIRQASLSFGIDDAMLTAALTLAFMVAVQTLMSGGMLVFHNRQEFSVILRRWKPCLLVGATSILGSAGWFTAFTLERAAYVKTLGQVEFLFTLAISIFYFKERPNGKEIGGMLLLVAGVILLLVAP
jgi:drug/metabolite transporter (DMT)-like permease